MPNTKTTNSYMMRAIVANCKCGERPVIAYDQASNMWSVKCNACEAKTETTEEPFIAIDEWNISSMTGMTLEHITSRAQYAGHAARMYALVVPCVASRRRHAKTRQTTEAHRKCAETRHRSMHW